MLVVFLSLVYKSWFRKKSLTMSTLRSAEMQDPQQKESMDVSQFPPGIYFLQLKQQDARIVTKKLVVAR